VADETLSFSIIARDQASTAFRETARSASDLAGKMDTAARTGRVLDESLQAQGRAARDQERAFKVSARATAIYDEAMGMLRDGALEAEYALKKETEAAKKSGRAAVEAAAENRTLADSLRKVAGSSFFKPSGMGTAIALSPALIPLAAGVAAGVGAIGVSFGAAAIGAGVFGLAARSVLSQASTDAQKLSALNVKLATATTAAQKKAVQQQIATLTAGWAKGYTTLIGQYQDFHQKWKGVSQAIAVPALSSWLGALTKGLPLLKTAVMPVADVFQLWGKILRDNFADPAIMKRLQGMAAAFGQFSAAQLTLVGRGIADMALGVFHLGQDLAGSGANFNAAGVWFMNMGEGFLSWSKSAKARADVQGFMHYLHQEGPVVGGILKNLGTILPGIFKGASATGTLELQAIGGLMSLIAKLPKGWQAPLTEAAGAMLLLSKTGVVSVGFKLLLPKGGAGGIAEKGGAAGLWGKLLPGVRLAGTALIATVAVDMVLKNTSSGKGKNWFDNPFGMPGPKDKASSGNWLTSFAPYEHLLTKDIPHWWDMMWNNTVGRAGRGVRDTSAIFDDFRHRTAVVFDGARHDIAHIWDMIWNNTVTRVQHGISDVTGWFRKLPGMALGALTGLGHSLYAFAHSAMGELWSGFRSVAGSIIGWIKGFGSSIISGLKGLFGIHSPSSVFHGIGENLMHGLLNGLKAGHGKVGHFLQSSVSKSLLGGVQGAFSASAATAQRYASSLLSMYGWSQNQMSSLVPLWNQESGWSSLAVNPNSGAYGIPQALPAVWGHPYALGDYKNQVVWGLNYIRSTYGSPAAAEAHEQASGWYGGGFHGWFDQPTVIGVGERGRERVDITPGGGSGGGTVININVSVPVSANPRDVGRQIADVLKPYIKSGGTIFPAGVTPR